MQIKGSNIKITELPNNFQELTTSEISTVVGGRDIISIPLSPVAASYLLGETVANNEKATYTVSFDNGKLSDQISVIPPVTINPDDPSVAGARAKNGIFF